MKSFFPLNKRTLVWALSALTGVLFVFVLIVGTRLYLEWRVEQAFAPNEQQHEEEASSIFHRLFGEDDITIAPAAPIERVSFIDGLPRALTAPDQLVAVMIENFPSSRPQMSGLADAGLVYEALAEGGITRFMALFDGKELDHVGPVRSARPYFVDWASEYGAAYAHAGGSTAALRQLVKAPVFDLDEDGELLFRDFRYVKPHNLFLDLAGLQDFLVSRAWQAQLIAPRFSFAADPTLPQDASPIEKIWLDFSFPEYLVQYSYDPVSGLYRRFLGNVLHADSSGQPVRPTNIIVQFTEYTVLDDAGRLDMRTIGTGDAWYFTGGQYFRGTWEKADAESLTKFFDTTGAEIQLATGQTWIEVIERGRVTLK